MVKANELRIGNWVSIDSVTNGRIKKIEEKFIESECLEGINLSEDWLGRFEFPVDSLVRVGYNGNDFLRGEMSVMYGSEFIRKIKYVHELQNLYFSLTGKELKCN